MSYTNTFTQTILENSTSNIWEDAKIEWRHIGSHLHHESNCICGHSIHEVCTIQNSLNNITLEVGNVCVRKFMNIDRNCDFKLIKKDLIDLKLLKELLDNNIINNWEYNYYSETKRKRKLTIKQQELREDIVKKSKEWVMINKKEIKGIIDPYVFKNLKEEKMIIKKEHTKMLGDFLVQQGYKISQGKSDKTFEEVFETLKQTLLQVKKLKESYGK